MKYSMNGNFLKMAGLTAAACLFLSVPGLAQSGKNGEFTIHNETTSNTVVGFYTNDGTGWSTNWLSSAVGPGDTADMMFNKSGGRCKQTLRVGWKAKGGGEVKDDPIDIDICQASNVYLHDNEITFD